MSLKEQKHQTDRIQRTCLCDRIMLNLSLPCKYPVYTPYTPYILRSTDGGIQRKKVRFNPVKPRCFDGFYGESAPSFPDKDADSRKAPAYTRACVGAVATFFWLFVRIVPANARHGRARADSSRAVTGVTGAYGVVLARKHKKPVFVSLIKFLHWFRVWSVLVKRV